MRLLRHRLFAPVCLFLFIFLLTILSARSLILSTPSIARMEQEPHHALYCISSFDHDAYGACTATLRPGNNQMQGMRILILSREQISLRINGRDAVPEAGSVTGLIRSYTLPEEYNDVLLLTFSSAPGAAAVCTDKTAATLLSGLNFGLPVFYGILLALIISSFTMLMIRPIAMLQVFTAYLVCVFLWGVRNYLGNMMDLYPLLGIISEFCFDFAVVLGAATCLFFSKRNEALMPITSAQMAKLLAVCILFTILSQLLP